MQILGHDPSTWMVIIGATAVKVMTSPFKSWIHTASTIGAAVFAAVVFTDPMLVWLELDANVYRNALAALLALTGEGLMRLAITITADPKRALDLVRAWRGGK